MTTDATVDPTYHPLCQVPAHQAPADVTYDTYAKPVAEILGWTHRLTDDDVLLVGAWAHRRARRRLWPLPPTQFWSTTRGLLHPVWRTHADEAANRSSLGQRRRQVAAHATLGQPDSAFTKAMAGIWDADWCVKAALIAVLRPPAVTDEQTADGRLPFTELRQLVDAAAGQPPSVRQTVLRLAGSGSGFPGTPRQLVAAAAATELGSA